jgi:hypothetical protein
MSEKIKAIREMIESENRRINERLTVLIQFAGLLFAAVALAWNKDSKFIIVVSVLGFCTTIIFLRSLVRAQIAIYELMMHYWNLPKAERDEAGPVIGIYQKNSSHKWRVYFTPPFGVPFCITIAWGLLIVYKFFIRFHITFL